MMMGGKSNGVDSCAIPLQQRKAFRFGVAIVGVIVVCLTVFLSVRPSPYLGELSWLPRWLTAWTDTGVGQNMRTGVPFLVLGAVVILFVRSKQALLIGAMGLFALPLVVEGLQFFFPRRSPALADVIWGWTGGLLGLVVGAVIIFLFKHLQKSR